MDRLALGLRLFRIRSGRDILVPGYSREGGEKFGVGRCRKELVVEGAGRFLLPTAGGVSMMRGETRPLERWNVTWSG
jgi:hypothetical protein